MASVRERGLGLWPRLNAVPVCDDSIAEPAYAALTFTVFTNTYKMAMATTVCTVDRPASAAVIDRNILETYRERSEESWASAQTAESRAIQGVARAIQGVCRGRSARVTTRRHASIFVRYVTVHSRRSSPVEICLLSLSGLSTGAVTHLRRRRPRLH